MGLLGVVLLVVSFAVPSTQGDRSALAAPGCETENPMRLWSGRSCLRGANIFQQAEVGDPWYPTLVARDFVDLRRAGANYVNLSVPGVRDVTTHRSLPRSIARLDELVDWAERAGLYVVISFRTGPGRSESDVTGVGPVDRSVFSEPDAGAAYASMWRSVASRYKSRRHVVGYDLMVEPHSVAPVQWRRLAKSIVAEIRTVDRRTPILISPPNWGVAASLENWRPLRGKRIVTTVHQYQPFAYTHFGKPRRWVARLERTYADVAGWRERTGQPIVVNEFGVRHTVPRSASFLRRQLGHLERSGYSHAVWIWEVRDPIYTFRTFDVKENPALLRALRQRWAQNVAFP